MRLASIVAALLVSACTSSASPSEAPPASGSGSAEPLDGVPHQVILVGQIVTMDDPPVVEAIAFADGEVLATGTRDEVMTLADDATEVIDLGSNVAYPGFIDAHSHWIGDREVMGIGTPEEAIAAALVRGWTSIAELWVDQARMTELEALAESDGLRMRVDGYLALNLPAPTGDHLGDWYLDYPAGLAPSDRLRFPGVKFTLDNGWGSQFWWEADELATAVAQADEAGWQVAIHTVSGEAHDMVLDAYEAALAGESNTLHHRIEHAIQVTDEQLARMVALDVATVIHLDGASADWVLEADYLGHLGESTASLARWRDFVDAGLHLAAASDTPWIYPDFALTDEMGRPFDQIAGGMDGVGRSNPNTPEWVLLQTLTAEQGLAAVTTGAAYALNDEAHRGHLAPGTYADITILSGDATAGTPDEIRDLQIIATIVGGVTEFCADPAMCP